MQIIRDRTFLIDLDPLVNVPGSICPNFRVPPLFALPTVTEILALSS